MGLFKFLKSLRTLANNRNITIEEAYKFAQQEFGEVSDLLKLQINKIFKEAEAPSIKKPESKNNVFTLIPKDKLKPAKMEELPSEESGTIMDRLSGAANRLKELMKEREAMYKPKKGLDLSEGLTRALARKILDRKRIQIPKGQDPINVFSDIFGESINDVKNLADEMVEIDQRGGGMKNMDEMLEAEGLYDIEIPKNPQRGMTDEELQKFIKEEDVKSEADEDYLRKIIDPEEPEDFATGGRVGLKGGGSYDYTSFDHKINELLAAYKRYKKGSATGGRKGILTFEQFFPLFAAENFATGGRVGYGKGGAVKEGIKALIEKINKKFGKGTVKLGKDVKRPESAEMREAFMAFKKRNKLAGGGAVKTILKIIQEIKKLDPMDAMKEVNEVVAKRGKYKNLSDEEVQKIFEDTNDHIFERDVPADEFAVRFEEEELDKLKNKYQGEEFDRLYDDYLYYKNEEGNFTGSFEDFIKARRKAGSLDAEMIQLKKLGAPKMAERFELKQKYPGIDDKLLTQIIDDPDPQRKAEVLATIDQAFELMKQGKSHEEVLDIMKQRTDRTKQAGGGLAYLMGL